MAAIAVSWEFAAKLFIPNVFAKDYDQESDEFKWVAQQGARQHASLYDEHVDRYGY